ncbi:MAG: class I SAM-dependent methyltransferase [Caldilineaceae bacterium]|nr:class I SAM-dependent methyltransferase [Caldilineaceae bacterium]
MLSDTEIWRGWLDWLPTAQPSVDPRHFFGQYQVHLVAHGLTESAATQRLNSIRRMMRTNADGWALMFDNIYANPTPAFQTLPNRLLVNAVAGITAGRALDISAGQGRNALFLAQAGWDVTAVDVSEVGLQVAARNAQEAGVQLRTACQNWQEFDYGTNCWDLLVLTYTSVPLTQAEMVARLTNALSPNGMLVVETYASEEDAPTRRPVDLDPVRLRSAWSHITIKHFEDRAAQSDWDQQPTRLVRMITVK